jgi:hypothetical protein
VTGQLEFEIFARAVRVCAWCGNPIRRAARRDAETCTKACRQARQRFRIAPAAEQTGAPMRFAIADPPYPQLAERYYKDHPDFGGEVDHPALIARLLAEHPDGWALCTSADALQTVLAMCPPGTRTAIWVKGSRPGDSWRARNAYEPVLIYKGRARKLTREEHLDDVLIWGGRQSSHPGALVGMKPAPFCEWLFRQLGALGGDELVDLFPGSGAVGRAWKLYSNPAAVVHKRRRVPSRLEEAATRTLI